MDKKGLMMDYFMENNNFEKRLIYKPDK